jgi:hypothetical protein
MAEVERGPKSKKYRKKKRWPSSWPGRVVLSILAAALILAGFRLPQFVAVLQVRQLDGQLGWGVGSSLPRIYQVFFWVFGTADSISLHGARVTNGDSWVFGPLHDCRYVSLMETRLTGGLAALNGEHALHHLFLNDNKEITDADLHALHFSNFPHLAALALTLSPKVTGTGFAGPKDCPSLKFLSVGTCGSFSNDGLAAICRFTNLQALILSGTSITDSGLRCLMRLKDLRIIELDDTRITEGGLRTLSHIASLRDIAIENDNISVRSLRCLRKLPRLKYLRLAGDGIRKRDAEAVLGRHVRVDLRQPSGGELLILGE